MAFDVGGSERAVAPKINVTPLVDVVLVLLIIFMVITPLLTKKFWLHVPKNEEKVEENSTPDEKNKNVVLSYHKGGVIKINNEPVTRAELPEKLRRILAAKGDRLIFFDAEDDADYGQAVEVMDLARGAGASAIAVLSETVLQQKGSN
jgi:biopolymer transport protein ExbD/biopolymer transport protein TolR